MKHLEAFLSAMKADAAIIHRPENMRWLAGYTGEGCLFVSKDIQAIVTDFRYVEQSRMEAPGWTVHMTSAAAREGAILNGLAKDIGAKQVYAETDRLTYDEYRALESALEGIELISLAGIPEKLREIKDAAEIESICKAAAIACKAFENILEKLHAGMTEKQAQIMLDYEMLMLGSEGVAFDTIAAAGANGALPHATPSDHIIANGELLTLDFGATVNGYRSDMTRTIGFGKVGTELREIYDTVYTAQKLALDAIAPNMPCGEIDRIAREYIDARYPGAFGHSLGHGVGLFIHEQPRVITGNEALLLPGLVITIEPGVYIPGVGGCRIEDMAIMTSEGYINPSTSPKHLIEL